MTNVNKKILIVDHDDGVRNTIAQRITLIEEHIAIQAATGEQVLALVKDQHFEMILLDVDLPDIDGRDLCRLMRRQGVKTPIIILGSDDGDAEVILALDSGASDYVAKPFHLGVLLARIRAHQRQFEQFDDATFPIGPYAFRPSTKFLINRETDKKIHLTEKEVALLKYLYHMGDRPAERKALLDQVWGYSADVTSHTLESHIYRLRQKVEPDPTNAQILVTERDGYRLVR